MKKFLIPLLVLIVANIMPRTMSAQNYVLDDNFEDSVYIFDIVTSKESKVENVGKPLFKLPLGDTVNVTRKLEGNDYYAVIKRQGKEYAIASSYILFCDNNPKDVIDSYNTAEKENHTFKGKFFATLTPYMIIAGLFTLAMLFTIIGIKSEKARGLALKVVPALIFLAAILEMLAYNTLGSKAFWWCEYGRYGFFGSLLRAIPFVLFAAFQIYSIKLYEKLLVGEDSGKKLSIIPAAISIVICIPALIVAAIICNYLDIKGIAEDSIELTALLGSLAVGIIFSIKKNTEVLGKKAGLLFTIFSIVYILGSLVAIWGVIIVIFRLILQILVIVGSIIGMSYVMGTRSSAGSSSSQAPIFYDRVGGVHNNSFDRDKANEQIEEKRNNSF